MRRAILLCLTLAGCASGAIASRTGGTATPDRAILYPVGVTLLMSDRTLCVGHRPGRARDWTGQLSGCPHLLPYQVRNSDPTLPRLELSKGASGTGPGVTVGSAVFSAP